MYVHKLRIYTHARALWRVIMITGRLASDALAGGSRPLGQAEEGNPPLFLFEGGHLCAAMHGAGINLRYLPMVRDKYLGDYK